MSIKSAHKIVRAGIARILCLCHIGLSIFVLFSIKRDFLYLIPLIGAIFLIAESSVVIILFRGKEPTSWFSSVFFVYVTTIVSCYWFLELENIKKVVDGVNRNGYQMWSMDFRGDIVSNIKIIWSSVELQIFFSLIMLIRWLIPKSSLSPQGLSDLLFKYFAISCDMLDFLTILQDNKLARNSQLVYWTLGVWSWSTIQFFIYVPKFEDEEKREFTAYITNSLLSVLFLDFPFFGVRMAAIFGFGSHNYNSYFFATKNAVMILLQIVRVKATFSERDIRRDQAAQRLKDKLGFDKESRKLFDQSEIAKRNFIADRLKKQRELREAGYGMKNKTPDSMRREYTDTSITGDRYESSDSLDETNNQKRVVGLPIKNMEALQSVKKAIYKESLNHSHSIDNDLNFDQRRRDPREERLNRFVQPNYYQRSNNELNNRNYQIESRHADSNDQIYNEPDEPLPYRAKAYILDERQLDLDSSLPPPPPPPPQQQQFFKKNIKNTNV